MWKTVLGFLVGCVVGAFFVYHPIDKTKEARWEYCKVQMNICNLEFKENINTWCNNY